MVRTYTHEDLTGKTFHRWTVLDETKRRKSDNKLMWKCVCDCGCTSYIVRESLISGRSKSCGCLRSEVNSQKTKKERIWNDGVK